MTLRLVAVVFMALAAPPASASQARPVALAKGAPVAAAAAIEMAQSALSRAYARNDAANLVREYYAEDAVLIVRSEPEPLRGAEPIAGFWTTLFGAVSLRMESASMSQECDLVVERGHLVVMFGSQQSPNRIDRTAYLAVWRLTREGWRVTAHAIKAFR